MNMSELGAMMANGRQVAKRNVATFIAWSLSLSDEEFKAYIYKGRLNRSEIASECCFARSVLIQNPAIKSALDILEERLRVVGVLPPIAVGSDNPLPPLRNHEVKQRIIDGQRLNRLEQENASLRAELQGVKSKLKQLGCMQQFLEETGRMPR